MKNMEKWAFNTYQKNATQHLHICAEMTKHWPLCPHNTDNKKTINTQTHNSSSVCGSDVAKTGHINTHVQTGKRMKGGGEQSCLVPLHHSNYSKLKGICLCVSGLWGDTHSRGIPLPRGCSGAFFPLEPLKMEVGMILVHTYAQSHECHTNPAT